MRKRAQLILAVLTTLIFLALIYFDLFYSAFILTSKILTAPLVPAAANSPSICGQKATALHDFSKHF